ncbi:MULTISPECIES: type II toxin-antitoxin system RelE/ParE family toxin [Pseudomonas]|uniref:type II toxin-antitoxin system RelE/ParE family toxin n=1 Tax=Pseudomonas TaxID=286 RepID=UPI0005FCAEF1|nr:MULTISPECIES: type II toxin-antitoxin system RelE/ParE family toxin [Pseudomonas]QZI70825.1 type II toxin-antitoxin system RelE/ParE family toxin [Pseudomonas protegens]BAQ83983.1 plasmid stabilization system protein [Pseudomonas sp. St29]
MPTLTIRYTETAQQSIEDQIVHLADYSDLKSAFERLDAVIDALQDKLLSAPLGYPVSPQASDLGILHYRELNTDGYRVFYEIVDADQAIVVGLVLRDKQSVEQALIRYCLLHTD